MGGFAQISAGSVGSAAANAGYITRPAAAEEGDELYHNAPEDVERAETWEDTRIRLRSWAEQVEAEEKIRHGNRAGQARTHYRGILSYEDKIETEAARADAQEFLEKEFPEAQAVGVVHQDTDHTHVHIWMSARKLDGKKVHIDNQDIKDLHETFDKIYERRMQVPSRNAEKVEETREFKREYARRWHQAHEKTGQLFREGVDTGKRLRVWRKFKKWKKRNRPDRADPPGPEVYRKREERQYGKEIGDEVEARVEARADEQRAEEAGEQKEVIEDLRQRHEKRERNRHGPRHEGGTSRDQRGADRDAPAARPGERGADEGGENRSDRRSGEGAQRDHERSEEREGSTGEPGVSSDGNGDSVSTGGRSSDPSSSEMGVGSSLDSGGGSGSSTSDLGDSQDQGSLDVRKHLAEGENAEAARVFDKLDTEDQERLWQTTTKELRGQLRRGRFKADREADGTERAYQNLSSDDQELVAGIQAIDRGILPDEKAEKVREAISRLDEDQRGRIRQALPSSAESAFEDIKASTEQSEEQSESQGSEKGETKGRGRGRGRGGIER